MEYTLPNVFQTIALELSLTVIMIFIAAKSSQRRDTISLRRYFQWVILLLIFSFVNIPMRIHDLGIYNFGAQIAYWLNTGYFVAQTAAIYGWILYIVSIQKSKIAVSFKRRLVATIPILVMFILCIISKKTGWVFSVDENGVYYRGSLAILQYVLPYSYIIIGLYVSIKNYIKTRNRRNLVITMSAFIPSVVTTVLQFAFGGSFVHVGFVTAALFINVEMVQEELKSIDTLYSLRELNKELESANGNLNDAVEKLRISVENEKKASAAKSSFLSRMSHDMRTPLNGIIGLIEIDEKHPDDVELHAVNRRKSKVAANHLISLINDVLDMSKLEDGKVELADEPLCTNELIVDVVSIVNNKAAEAGITIIEEKCGFEHKFAFGSPLHIRQVLLNIIGNAIKYNKSGGTVTISSSDKVLPDGRIEYTISIADTGIGMSKEYLKKIFEPFSQEHIDARSVYEGTGLGMSITKSLVEKMEGTISVESVEGVGSKFTVKIPLREAQRSDVTKNNESVSIKSIEGLKIILAEDNDLNAEIACEILSDEGAEIKWVENGKLAFDEFNQNPPGTYDVILMDCMMPVMDGLTATKTIRALEREDAKTIPIIAMTANAFAEDVRNCLESGMNDHVSKPIDIGTLLKTISKYI